LGGLEGTELSANPHGRLSFSDTGRWVEVGPVLIRPLDGDTVMALRAAPQGCITQLFVYGTGFVGIAWHETLPVLMALLGLTGLVLAIWLEHEFRPKFKSGAR
jgi:hypothetical protein